MNSLYVSLQPFSLILFRLSPLFLASGLSPLARFPAMVRLILLLILSISLTFLSDLTWSPLSSSQWFIGLGFEWTLGMLMLLGFQLLYAAIQMIGRALDMQIGFAAAGVIDPVSSNSDPLVGYMMTLFFTLAIFVTNTHHLILEALHQSIQLMPPGSWHGDFSVTKILGFFSSQMIFAVLLLGPVIMGLWLLDVFNGFIAKTMPQMNVYFVMLPLKIGVGIFLLSIAMGNMKPLLGSIFDSLVSWFQFGWVA
jgi:flagellar biosynthetic protein FliR